MLIGQKWDQYVEENKETLLAICEEKEDLFATLKQYSLFRFLFNIDEGYFDTDYPLENFPHFELSYVSGEERVSIHVGTQFQPTVNTKEYKEDRVTIKKNITVPFADYFKMLTNDNIGKLEAFFTQFGNQVLAGTQI